MGERELTANEDGVHTLCDRENRVLPAKALRNALLARHSVHERGHGGVWPHEVLHRVERLGHPGRLDCKNDQVNGLGLMGGDGTNATGLAVHGHNLTRMATEPLVIHHVLDSVRAQILLNQATVEQPNRTLAKNCDALDCHAGPLALSDTFGRHHHSAACGESPHALKRPGGGVPGAAGRRGPGLKVQKRRSCHKRAKLSAKVAFVPHQIGPLGRFWFK